ncbi:helix-turn-helix domain-containing protein [Phyllobacterium salinisoli]|uniref:winged helix-turn-helix transcriptional regulator n=1 Tax=Phyllobacterium salinisoli TaxID=1899321 RepID=UPI00315C68DE
MRHCGWSPASGNGVQDGPTRYGELRRAIRDVSDKMLIQQLKELASDGLVKRTDYKEIIPRVDYSLTPLGKSLAQALVPLCSWGMENTAEVTRVFARREGSSYAPTLQAKGFGCWSRSHTKLLHHRG